MKIYDHNYEKKKQGIGGRIGCTFLHLEELQSHAERVGILLVDGPGRAGDREHLPVVLLLLDREHGRGDDQRRYHEHYQPSGAALGELRLPHSQAAASLPQIKAHCWRPCNGAEGLSWQKQVPGGISALDSAGNADKSKKQAAAEISNQRLGEGCAAYIDLEERRVREEPSDPLWEGRDSDCISVSAL
ncbi:hypothetical protein BHE74_00020498 [Ensete ventricosum]|nr:hypothetical protein BHE74_00020498 [Ensete ventricosum]RZR98982.1 hypothetical protein BHM03_00028448 [Ensete ventricosum]